MFILKDSTVYSVSKRGGGDFEHKYFKMMPVYDDDQQTNIELSAEL